MELSSPAFENGAPLPIEYTNIGDNITPPLNIRNIPENAKSLAIIMDDPGGKIIKFVHWIVWNIPPSKNSIEKGEKILYPQGKNSFRKLGYLGPCPPYGEHQYFLKVYALDAMLHLKSGVSKKKLEEAMSGHIIDEAQLTCTFKK